MALKIRFRPQGCNNNAQYRLVVTDVRAPIDGEYIECLGWYNPNGVEDHQNFSLKAERIRHWLNMGAEITEKAVALLGRGAPEVIKFLREKQLTKRKKASAKRKAKAAKK